jgi:hypothetical protein
MCSSHSELCDVPMRTSAVMIGQVYIALALGNSCCIINKNYMLHGPVVQIKGTLLEAQWHNTGRYCAGVRLAVRMALVVYRYIYYISYIYIYIYIYIYTVYISKR